MHPGTLYEWSHADLTDPEVPVPDEVAKEAKGSKDYPSLYGPLRLPLRAQDAWLRAGLALVDQERTGCS